MNGSPVERMVTLLRECAEFLQREGAFTEAEDANDLSRRCYDLLAEVAPENVRELTPTLLTEARGDPLRHLEPQIGDMADAPAVDGRPE